MSSPLMGIFQEIAKANILAKKIDELNSNLRSFGWLAFFILVHSVDKDLTVNELIASAISMYVIMGIEDVFSFLWLHFRLGFSQAWAKRKEQKAREVNKDAS